MGIQSQAGRLAPLLTRFEAFDDAVDPGHDGIEACDCRIMGAAPCVQVTNEAGVQRLEFCGFLFERAREGRLVFCFCRRGCVLGVHFYFLAPAECLSDPKLSPTR